MDGGRLRRPPFIRYLFHIKNAHNNYTNKYNTFSISDIFSFLCFSLYAQLANSDGVGFQNSGFGLLNLSFVADFSVEHAKGTVKT